MKVNIANKQCCSIWSNEKIVASLFVQTTDYKYFLLKVLKIIFNDNLLFANECVTQGSTTFVRPSRKT